MSRERSRPPRTSRLASGMMDLHLLVVSSVSTCFCRENKMNPIDADDNCRPVKLESLA